MRRKWSCVGTIWAAILFAMTAGSTPAQSAIQSVRCKGVLRGTVTNRLDQPVPGFKVMAWSFGVDLGTMLPNSVTDSAGRYLFEHVCPGRYTVLPESGKVLFPYDFEFLYDRRVPEVKLSIKRPTAEIPVRLPPSPGEICVHVMNRATNEKIRTFTAEIIVPGQRHWRWIKIVFDGSSRDCAVAVPPDRNFVLHITAAGFQKWTSSGAGHKLLYVTSGQQQIIDVRLVPHTNN